MKKIVKVVIIGLGGMGTTHFNLYKLMKDVEIVALVDVEMNKINEKSKEINAHKYKDVYEMLKNENPDIVDICTPTYIHTEIAKVCIEKNINVITEKPMALKSQDIKSLFELSRKHNVKIMAAQVLRFWPEYMWLKEVFDNKTYGKIKHIRMWRTGEKPKTSWQDWMMDESKSGLVPFDLHIHDIDFMIYIFGEPKDMHPFEIKYGTDLNYINVIYNYKDATRVNIEAAWYDYKVPFTMGYEVIFESAYAEYKDGKLILYKENFEPEIIRFEEKLNVISGINVKTTDGYFNELVYFKDCVKNNICPSIVKENELICVLDLIEGYKNN